MPERSRRRRRLRIARFDAKSTVGVYIVSYADFPSKKRAQGYVDDFIKGMQSRITSNESVKVGDTTGRELVVKDQRERHDVDARPSPPPTSGSTRSPRARRTTRTRRMHSSTPSRFRQRPSGR